MKQKTLVKVFLSVVLCAFLMFTINTASKKVSEPGPGTEIAPSGPADYHVYRLNKFGLSFMYPSNWNIREENQTAADGSLETLLINGAATETVSIKVFDMPEDIEGFVKSNVASYTMSNIEDINATRSIISGCDGYSWVAKDNGNPIGGTLVFSSDNYLFVLNFTVKNDSDILALDDLIRTITTGLNGPTLLTFDVADTVNLAAVCVAEQTCCTLTDPSYNSYPCNSCCTLGNCTWYCEYRTSGANNYPGYGNAYKWMYNARYNGTKTYPTGGTIPEVGAIMVFDSGWYTNGHVAYVTGINSNGSINVAEQGCDAYCTRNGSYTTSTLRGYLAGYIYRDGSAPGPSAKTISGTIGASTIVDDYNFSNVYNFQAYGPGRNYGTSAYGWGTYNGGYNSWFHWTKTTSSQLCSGRWAIYIGTAGTYRFDAYIPSIHGAANNVRYHVDSTDIGGINQNSYYNVWVTAGSIYLSAGTHYVNVYDNESGTAGLELAFDAIRVTRTN